MPSAVVGGGIGDGMPYFVPGANTGRAKTISRDVAEPRLETTREIEAPCPLFLGEKKGAVRIHILRAFPPVGMFANHRVTNSKGCQVSLLSH